MISILARMANVRFAWAAFQTSALMADTSAPHSRIDLIAPRRTLIYSPAAPATIASAIAAVDLIERERSGSLPVAKARLSLAARLTAGEVHVVVSASRSGLTASAASRSRRLSRRRNPPADRPKHRALRLSFSAVTLMPDRAPRRHRPHPHHCQT